MKKKEMKKVRMVGNTFVTVEELRETMFEAGRYGWCQIQQYMCTSEGCLFPVFAEAVWVLRGANKELALGLICMMLQEADENEFASDLAFVCLRDELAMDSFMDGFNEAFEDYLHDDFELCDNHCGATDPEDDDDEYECECDSPEDPVFEVHIKVS
ncbi:MAG: hypothetical protein IKU44_05025, partial [Firmicutes bacterium]|nr:hypothetical protein [Bacillota bacterium]